MTDEQKLEFYEHKIAVLEDWNEKLDNKNDELKAENEELERLKEINSDLRKDMEYFKTTLFKTVDELWSNIMNDEVTGYDGMVCLGQWRILNKLIKQLGLDFDYAQYNK